MKVGTICKLKVDCLANKTGTLGVVFNDYGDGFQAIFENGYYDGFSRIVPTSSAINLSETELYLEEVGFEESLAGYQFKNVSQVAEDYRDGLFNIAWSEGWKDKSQEKYVGVNPIFAQVPKPFGSKQNQKEQLERCEVYVDGNRPALLRFKRKIGTGEKQTPTIQSRTLSAAKDYADFSHFEYADIGPSIFPRLLHSEVTLYPKYVVFHKKL